VIIESAPIAQYFEAVFLADWNNKAKPLWQKALQRLHPSPNPNLSPRRNALKIHRRRISPDR
jgi:hypothetical protein